MPNRPHPHVAIPPGDSPSDPSSSSSWSSQLYRSPPQDSRDVWSEYDSARYSPAASSSIPHISLEDSSHPSSRAASYYEHDSGHIAFPEPQLYRSVSQRSSLRPSPTGVHRATRSELTVGTLHHTGESRPPSFISTESSPDLAYRDLSDDISSLTVQEERLHHFQTGQLPDEDSQWHQLVPRSVREILDVKEVQRQSNLFEIIKTERDYVNDMQFVKEVLIEPLLNTSPVPQHRLSGFVSEVFHNLDMIQTIHQRLRDDLFARQRDQHPLIQSIADVILANILDSQQLFRSEYEKYIKHWPLARARHSAEYKRNSKYQYFLQQCYQDPRLLRRDLPSLLSRPVTRLPRLKFQLEDALKHTAPDHPDIDAIPPILDVLNDLIKSTQPGIEVSEGKVHFWELCESLVYQQGEIIDLDLYDEARTLIYSGPLSRRYRSEMGYSWANLHVALLDNYLLLLRPDPRSSGSTKHSVVSRPIPLEYLRLATFSSPPEIRKEKITNGTIFDAFRNIQKPMYPFTIYHASAKMNRRYTLYADSEEIRQEWHALLVDALGVRKVQQEANMWFAPHVVSEGFFKDPRTLYTPGEFTGKAVTAAPFSSGGRNLLAVACTTGVYAAVRGEAGFRKVLNLGNVSSMVPLPNLNKMLVLCDSGLSAYSLDLFGRAGLGISSPQHVEATWEPIAGQDSTVLFFRAGKLGHRTMILYVSKSLLHQVHFHALEVLRAPDGTLSPRRTSTGLLSTLQYRTFGEPLVVPKDVYAITSLNRSIGICTDKGIWIVDPTNPNTTGASPTIIPKFHGAESNAPLNTLKSRCVSAKPLGLVRSRDDEILVVYDELGCYVNKHGVPSRSSGYLRWESKATAFAHRGDHILLFSSDFIEVRKLQTGKLVQVIEDEDIRYVYQGLLATENPILVAMKGREEQAFVNDRIIELIETAEITTPKTASISAVWDEWDM